MFEIFALLLCTFAIAMVLWPLSKRIDGATHRDEIIFLKSQLADIDERLASPNAVASVLKEERTEIGRRILRASKVKNEIDPAKPLGRWGLTFVSLASIVLIPVLSATIYLMQGAPGTVDAPLARNESGELRQLPIEQLLARAESQLATNPDDVRGWKVVERVYARLGRVDDQATALRNIVRLDGESAERLALLAELRARKLDNIIDEQAKRLLGRAFEIDPNNVRTNFMMATAAEQEGDFQKALSLMKNLSARADPASELAPLLKQNIARLQSKLSKSTPSVMPRLDQYAMSAASEMSQQERVEFVRSMVDRLAAKLDENPSDAVGWQRLVNAYIVLKDWSAARSSLEKAAKIFGTDQAILARFAEIKERLNREEAKSK